MYTEKPYFSEVGASVRPPHQRSPAAWVGLGSPEPFSSAEHHVKEHSRSTTAASHGSPRTGVFRHFALAENTRNFCSLFATSKLRTHCAPAQTASTLIYPECCSSRNPYSRRHAQLRPPFKLRCRPHDSPRNAGFGAHSEENDSV